MEKANTTVHVQVQLSSQRREIAGETESSGDSDVARCDIHHKTIRLCEDLDVHMRDTHHDGYEGGTAGKLLVGPGL